METIIQVKRKIFTDLSTIGDFSYDGFQCFSLEDTTRKNGEKIFGKTSIPFGSYEVSINYSNRFGKLMPLIMNVPGFEGVRIHSGNKPQDTEGCILIGMGHENNILDQITESRKAYNDFFEKLSLNMKSGKVFIEIS